MYLTALPFHTYLLQVKAVRKLCGTLSGIPVLRPIIPNTRGTFLGSAPFIVDGADFHLPWRTNP
jgi:hypothetical protein